MKTETHEQCTVCFELLDSTEQTTLNDDILKLLKLLITKLNDTLLRNSPICETCLGKIKSACKFKASYLELHEAFPNIKVEDDAYSEKPVICEICKSTVNTCDAIPLFDPVNKTNKLMLINRLSPELESRISEELQTCEACHKSMVNFCSITNLLSVFDQDIISDESESESTSIKKEPKDIDSIPSTSSSNNALVFPETSGISIKKEIKTLKEDVDEDDDEDQDERATYEEFIAKNEELDLKMECDEEARTDRINEEKTTTSKDIIKCGFCEFKTKNCIKTHMLIHVKPNEINMLQCERCSYKALDKQNLITHICKYKPLHKQNLKGHLLKHTTLREVKMFHCEICEYKTKRKRYLKIHMLTHKSLNEVEVFQCAHCDYKSKYKNVLKTHMLTHKTCPDIEMFPCTLCDYKAKLKSCLKVHMLTHKTLGEVEIFQCKICKYKTKHKVCLNRHMLIHTTFNEVKTFQCEVCDYKSKYKYDLKKHMLTHKALNEVKFFQCKMCDYKAKRKSSLKSHMMTHQAFDDVEIFQCANCDYKSKYKNAVKNHMRTHKTR